MGARAPSVAGYRCDGGARFRAPQRRRLHVSKAEGMAMSMATGISKKRIAGLALFKWTLLTPLFGLLLFLVPVLLLQLYFSVHAWTVYLTSWWEADFVGVETFRAVLTDPRFLWSFARSFAFAGLSTLGCFL